jgi:hypothetical protein
LKTLPAKGAEILKNLEIQKDQGRLSIFPDFLASWNALWAAKSYLKVPRKMVARGRFERPFLGL